MFNKIFLLETNLLKKSHNEIENKNLMRKQECKIYKASYLDLKKK